VAPRILPVGVTYSGALALDGGKSRWTARVSARAAGRARAPVELAVDPASVYFFGPDSGRAIGAE